MSSDDLFEYEDVEIDVLNRGLTQLLYNSEISEIETISNQKTDHQKLETLLNKLNKSEIINLIKTINTIPQIPDGSSVVFHIFRTCFSNKTHSEDLTDQDLENLNLISASIIELRKCRKFDEIDFANSLFDSKIVIPWRIKWWFLKNDIITLQQYWDKCPSLDLNKELLKMLETNEEVIKDVLIELMCGCYASQSCGIRKIEKSRSWLKYCNNSLEKFIDDYLNILLNDSTNRYQLNIIELLRYDTILPNKFKKRFCLSLIQKFILLKEEKFDLLSTFSYQHLWTCKNLQINLKNVLEKIFDYCTLEDVISNLDKLTEKDINWKMFLILIAVSVDHSESYRKYLIAKVEEYLGSKLKKGKILDFKIAMLLIRQATYEDKMNLTYENWFSNMFGLNSKLKSSENQTVFKSLINFFNNVLKSEPEGILLVHVNKCMRAPSNCNNLMLNHKQNCRIRLNQLENYPKINNVNVLHFYENIYRTKKIDPLLLKIMKENYEAFYENFVPFLNVENDDIFSYVKGLFLEEKIVSQILLSNCKPPFLISNNKDDD